MKEDIQTLATFKDFGFQDVILKALNDLGYEEPSPIQMQAIPIVLAGNDMIGQAQTGTGKTAAFALPAITKIDASLLKPQVLVLAPTRELALQVSDAFVSYTKYLPHIKVATIYGGAPMGDQLKLLRQGVHVLVATPGRLVDHLRRNSKLLQNISLLVLDEADEMLKLGFMEDLDVIFAAMEQEYQKVLFSATLPASIRKIANHHLKNPVNIHIAAKTQTVERITQNFICLFEEQKIDAVLRILEIESFDAVIAFVRTKQETLDVATKIEARGYKVAALNGDIVQAQREKVIESLKDGRIDIVIATDVAARGIDVSRITHVINIDIPYDPESYVHRIGRTGRAGRDGKAILLVTPREIRMLGVIEKVTRQKITEMFLPNAETILNSRLNKLMESVKQYFNLVTDNHLDIAEKVMKETSLNERELALALLQNLIQGYSLTIEDIAKEYPERNFTRKRERTSQKTTSSKVRCKSTLGSQDGVVVKNIVGAIINVANVPKEAIGKIQIRETFTLIELPEKNIKDILSKLSSTKILGKNINLSIYNSK